MSDIPGYRNLTEAEHDAIVNLKSAERGLAVIFNCHKPIMNPRLAAIAKTHFEHGFMAAVKAIAKPEDVWEV